MIYLDNAATTKPKKAVVEAMMPYFLEKWHNPSALYSAANKVKKDVENARLIVADFLNVSFNEVYFTSGGSEGNSWAIKGFVDYCKDNNFTPIIVITPIEHKSILACVEGLKKNVNTYYVDVDRKGFIDLEQLEKMLHCLSIKDGNRILVSVQYANSEIGTIQHINEISNIVHKYNAVFHTDAVGAFGKVPINVKKDNIDILTASGHKIGCPKGIGILYKNKNVNINPLIYGGQMDEMRGGTENVPYIIAFAKAVELCKSAFLEKSSAQYDCRDYMISRLKEKFGCIVNGDLERRLPNNINVTFSQNITGEALIYMLDMCDIYVSAGSACDSRSVKSSTVLKAIGLTDEQAKKTIRISLPDDVDMHIIDNVIEEIKKQIKLLVQ